VKRQKYQILLWLVPVILLGLVVFIARARPAEAEPVTVTPLPPVTNVDGFAGVCYSHYEGPGDRRYFGLVQDIGVHHDRIDFRWDVISNVGVGYEPYDSVVNDAAAYGIEIIAILMATPSELRNPGCDTGSALSEMPAGASAARPQGWYFPDEGIDQVSALQRSDPGACPPANLYNDWSPGNFNGNVWAEWVYNTVMHFKGRISVWEIWNEPEWDYFWLGSDAEYAQLLKVGYQAVKAADPNATVLFGGLHYWADRTFYERVLDILNDDQQAAADNYYFDAMSVHLYSRSSTIYDVVNDIRAKMQLYVSDHPIWLTETGVPVDDGQFPVRPPYNVTESEQAAYLLQSYANARAARVERYHWFRVHDADMVEHFGLMRDDTYLRPSYVAYQVATTYLLSPTMVTNWNYASGVRRVSLWGTPWGKVSVLWNTKPDTQQFQYAASLPTATLVDRRGHAQTITASGGVFDVTLPGATAYITDQATGERDYFIGGDPYLVIEDDTTPPTVSLNPLLATTYSRTIEVSWTGSDSGSGIWGYDVQVKEGSGGTWIDWLHLTPYGSGEYSGGAHGQTYCFRARAWDRAGNLSTWTDGAACTTLDYVRDVSIEVGAVVGDGEPPVSLTNLTFRFLAPDGTDVVAPAVGDSWEATLTLEAGTYSLMVIPETWGDPPPGWLPALIPMPVEPGPGTQDITYPVVTLAQHNFSYLLPVIRRRN